MTHNSPQLGQPVRPPGLPEGAWIVWLVPPEGVEPDAAEGWIFGPEERAAFRALPGPARRRAQRLWGRAAAKEAARGVIRSGRPAEPIGLADLRVDPDGHGRPVLSWARDGLAGRLGPPPAVSIAHTDGLALALAAPDPEAPVGIDAEPVVARSARFEELALLRAERARLDRLAPDRERPDRAGWLARFWCAKEALGKATGRGLIVGPASVEVVEADPASGLLIARPGPDLAAACPAWKGRDARVETALRDGFAWAWTLGEGTEVG